MAKSRFFYRSIEDAKRAVLNLRIRNLKEYQKRHKVDSNLPSNPAIHYKNSGWSGWKDFLSPHPNYETAVKTIRRLSIRTRADFDRQRKTECPEIPENPESYYKNNGWIDWKHFLSKETYESYEEAREAVQRMGITTAARYFENFRIDPRLPSNPNLTYKNKGWVNWFHFFGKDKQRFYPYEECCEVVRNMEIRKYQEYKDRYKSDPRLPSNPEITYKNSGWVSWNTFLGKPTEHFYATYEEAKDAVWKLEIVTQTEYRKGYKRDPMLPSNPNVVYLNKGWTNWHDYLGNEPFVPYATYEEASQAVQALKISSVTEYRKRYLEDEHLHSHPNIRYKDQGWQGWKHFLGTENEFVDFAKAKELVQKNNFRTSLEYIKNYRKIDGLPSNPQQYYKEFGWKGWKDFLGTQKKK